MFMKDNQPEGGFLEGCGGNTRYILPLSQPGKRGKHALLYIWGIGQFEEVGW